jgi:hypothetical protein
VIGSPLQNDVHVLARECLATLVSASCAMRYNVVSASEARRSSSRTEGMQLGEKCSRASTSLVRSWQCRAQAEIHRVQ